MVRKKNQLFRTGKVPIIKDRQAEHQSPKPGVAGSSPATPASYFNSLDGYLQRTASLALTRVHAAMLLPLRGQVIAR
jgi:hypothetical protein